MSEENNNSALGKVFGVIGAGAGISAGVDSDMGGWGILFLVIILGSIGYGIGAKVEQAIVKLLFIIGSIITYLINATVRRFVWDIILSIFGGN